jgi:hypothetical protein
MSGDHSIFTSEVFTYGLMILNVVVWSGVLLWAWRAGHLRDLDSAAEAVAPSLHSKEGDRE